MTATQQLSRDLGWAYFEKLAKQKVMQVQSAADPPKKLALGERAVMADGTEYMVRPAAGARRADRGGLRRRGHAADHRSVGRVMARAANPNAARLFYAWSMTAEAQQLNVDVGALRSVHPLVKDRPERKKLSDIKTLREDAAAVADQADDIKARYLKLFKV